MASVTKEDVRKTKIRQWTSYSIAKAERLDGLYKTHPTDALQRNAMITALKSVLVTGRVLDVGCGTGDITVALHDAGYSMTGLDISDSMLFIFKKNIEQRHIPIIVGDIFEIDPPTEKFDAATCRYVFSHYHDFELLLSKIAEYVCPGGYIIFDAFASEAVTLASKLLGTPTEDAKVFGTLASFSDSDLKQYCQANNMRIVARHSSAFFHRNPIFASTAKDIATYDAELASHINHPEVRKFIAWFQESVASKLPSNLSGTVINIVQKLPD